MRVIQEKTLRRIGSETETFIDVRFLSATNNNINLLIQNNEFSADLFHRINTLTLCIPSLKDRSSLTRDFIANSNDMVTRNNSYNDSITIKKDTLKNMQHEILVAFLNDYKWNRKELAEKLDISRSTLWRKLND